MEQLVVGGAFIGGFLLIFGVNLLYQDVVEMHRRRMRERLEEEMAQRRRERARETVAYKELYELAAEGYGEIRLKPTLRERLTRLVDESGMLLRPQQLVTIALGLAAVLGLGVGFATGNWVPGVAAAPVGMALPFLYISIVRARRQEKLLSQLPEAFELMARSMRAGQTMTQAMQAVADEFSPPISDEFGYCCDQQNLGLSPEAALRDMARRTGLLELKIFILAVVVHRQTGGNLAELLEKLAKVIRDRSRIRGAIKALTAEGRFQAIILLALPPFMMAALMVIKRPYIMTLFEYPMLIVAMFAMMTIGGIWMHRIVNFDF